MMIISKCIYKCFVCLANLVLLIHPQYLHVGILLNHCYTLQCMCLSFGVSPHSSYTCTCNFKMLKPYQNPLLVNLLTTLTVCFPVMFVFEVDRCGCYTCSYLCVKVRCKLVRKPDHDYMINCLCGRKCLYVIYQVE